MAKNVCVKHRCFTTSVPLPTSGLKCALLPFLLLFVGAVMQKQRLNLPLSGDNVVTHRKAPDTRGYLEFVCYARGIGCKKRDSFQG